MGFKEATTQLYRIITIEVVVYFLGLSMAAVEPPNDDNSCGDSQADFMFKKMNITYHYMVYTTMCAAFLTCLVEMVVDHAAKAEAAAAGAEAAALAVANTAVENAAKEAAEAHTAYIEMGSSAAARSGPGEVYISGAEAEAIAVALDAFKAAEKAYEKARNAAKAAIPPKGIMRISARNRSGVRCMLLVAIVCSATSSFLAVMTFVEALIYKFGCVGAGLVYGSTVATFGITLFGVIGGTVHLALAWVAAFQS